MKPSKVGPAALGRSYRVSQRLLAWGVMNFLAEVLVFLCSPISWVAGLALGFLFHKEMRKLGWGLLFFVVPGIGSLSASSGGGLYESMARFIAVACLTAIVYLLLEQRLYRKAGHRPHA